MIALLAGVFALPANARAETTQPGPPIHDQVIPYIFVVFCILLGVILICRSAGRSKDVKLNQDDD